MKGALSDSGSLFCTRLQQQLFPGSTYSVVSGGDPVNITDLTFKQLCEFHRLHYHPSNSRFYTYGDYPVERHLEYLNPLLSRFERLPVMPAAKLQSTRYSAPRSYQAVCAPDTMGDPDRQLKAAVSFLIENNNGDSYNSFLLRLATSLLIDGQSSPMYRVLIESNLGADYAPGTGLDTSTWQPSFTVGVQGALNGKEGMPETIESAVMDCLERVVNTEGFSKRQIEAAVHQIELSLRHVSVHYYYYFFIFFLSFHL